MKHFAIIFFIVCGLSLSDCGIWDTASLTISQLVNPNILATPSLNAPPVNGQVQSQSFKFSAVSRNAISF